MAFMKPQIVKDTWIELDTSDGTQWIPSYEVEIKIPKGFKSEEKKITEDALLEFYSEDSSPDIAENRAIYAWEKICHEFRNYVGPRETIYSIALVKGWGARLSAPGYMDRTDWTVYDSEEEAKKELAGIYDLCPVCLEDLNINYECEHDFIVISNEGEVYRGKEFKLAEAKFNELASQKVGVTVVHNDETIMEIK